jgi:hypothetical protein
MTIMQIAKKATVQSKVLITKMDWWQKGTHEEAGEHQQGTSLL